MYKKVAYFFSLCEIYFNLKMIKDFDMTTANLTNDNLDLESAINYAIERGVTRQEWAQCPESIRKTVAISVMNNIQLQVSNIELEVLAGTDSLTGLPNKYAFDEMCSDLRKNKTKVALFMIDLNRFKPINDDFGHDIGDEVLKVITSRLQNKIRHTENRMRPSDIVFRWGGDEFVILCPECDVDHVDAVTARIADSFKDPIRVRADGKEVSFDLGGSVGSDFYPDGMPDTALHDVDIAMLAAKEAQKKEEAKNFVGPLPLGYARDIR